MTQHTTITYSTTPAYTVARLDYDVDERDHDKTNLSFAIETALVLGVNCSRIEKHSFAVSRNQYQSEWHCVLHSSEFECGFVRREVPHCASRKKWLRVNSKSHQAISTKSAKVRASPYCATTLRQDWAGSLFSVYGTNCGARC
jgi:hypothetical protein